MKTCAFTGHRPKGLGYPESDGRCTALKEKLRSLIIRMIEKEGVTHFISGMARGVDLWAAQLVLELKKQNPDVKLLCAVPYENFEKRWSPAWRQCYHDVLAAADYKKSVLSVLFLCRVSGAKPLDGGPQRSGNRCLQWDAGRHAQHHRLR